MTMNVPRYGDGGMLFRRGGRVRVRDDGEATVKALARALHVGGPTIVETVEGLLAKQQDSERPAAAVERPQRKTTSDGYPIVCVTDVEATDAAWWARTCARELGIPTPEVRFFEAPASARFGFVDLSLPGVVFIRRGMDQCETRSAASSGPRNSLVSR
jgi:hypothetical protein